jgi:carbon-monoxide dehydrogenase large subunit
VRWVEDRAEHFVASIHERDQLWEVEIAVDAQGVLRGLRGRMLHDQGAYTPQGINLPYNAATSVTGPYKVPAYDLEVLVCQTNKTPVVPVRGAGYPQAAFVMERLMDRVARELRIDRAELRLRNYVPPGRMPYEKGMVNRAGVRSVIDGGDYPRCQAIALERIDYPGFAAREADARRRGRRLGLGLAAAVKATSRGPFESALVRVSPQGRISVYTRWASRPRRCMSPAGIPVASRSAWEGLPAARPSWPAPPHTWPHWKFVAKPWRSAPSCWAWTRTCSNCAMAGCSDPTTRRAALHLRRSPGR